MPYFEYRLNGRHPMGDIASSEEELRSFWPEDHLEILEVRENCPHRFLERLRDDPDGCMYCISAVLYCPCCSHEEIGHADWCPETLSGDGVVYTTVHWKELYQNARPQVARAGGELGLERANGKKGDWIFFGDPDAVAIMDRVIAACERHGVSDPGGVVKARMQALERSIDRWAQSDACQVFVAPRPDEPTEPDWEQVVNRILAEDD